MTQPESMPDIVPAGFFVLRTPLLPFEELEAWIQGTETADADNDQLAAALEADRQLLRDRLRELIERPEIRDALFIASPSLLRGLEAWRRDPDSKKGRRAEEALVRYLLRMTTRCTPFGLFSGCSVGTVGASSRLRLAPRAEYRRHTRLDMGYLFGLGEELARDPRLRRSLRFHTNSSLYQAAGRWRYAEARRRGSVRSHHLVAVDSADYLDSTLERARAGATLEELAQALVAEDSEVSVEEAEEFIVELIDGQLLVSDLAPPITGPGPIHQLIDQLSELPVAGGVTTTLEGTRDALAQLDSDGLGADPAHYVAVADRLEKLPAEVDLPRLFQVDMIKPDDQATLGPAVLDEVTRGVELLWRLSGSRPDDALTHFCQSFVDRYEEGRTVPLVEALDEEVGIGFQRSSRAEASPLLEGVALPAPPTEPTAPWGPWPQMLLRKLEQALVDGAEEIEIEAEDLKGFPTEGLPPLPDALQVMATVASASADPDDDDFQVFLHGGSGPSGMQYLGRFCHADETLRKHVEEQLRAEEALDPDAIFAEIVHVGEGRLGNILARPAMRDYEIPFLANGAASHQIPVTDLMVTVWGQRVVLHSARLGRRIVPRLTSAHNYTNHSLGIYRFLCTLQTQGLRNGLRWQWGAFDSLAFLPRVRSGRLVLSRARWLVGGAELRELNQGDAATRYRAFEALRHRRGLPRWTLLVDGDNELLVDAANVLSVETLLALAKKRGQIILAELFPGPDELCARGPEGRFTHEALIPLRSQRQPTPRRPTATSPSPKIAPAVRRSFPPGSEWLYAKLYTGTFTADRVLREVVGPLARHAVAQGAADRWFFIRYGDPHWHLRLRFHGEPRALHSEVLEPLQATASRLIDGGYLWRFQIDTYERETERYGGADGIELAERLAHADSDAVLQILESLEGDEGTAARWRLALRGSDLLLDDLGFEGEAKLAVIQHLQESYAREFRVGPAARKQMASRLRRERRELEGVLDRQWDAGHPLAPGFAALAHRSHRLAPFAAELRAREATGRLTTSLAELAFSYIHMFVNRLMRSEGRVQEVVLHDFLYQMVRSKIAREKAQKARRRADRTIDQKVAIPC